MDVKIINHCVSHFNQSKIGPLWIEISQSDLNLQANQMQYSFAYLKTMGGAHHLFNKPGVALTVA
jgi:hypothetical protein